MKWLNCIPSQERNHLRGFRASFCARLLQLEDLPEDPRLVQVREQARRLGLSQVDEIVSHGVIQIPCRCKKELTE